MRKEGDWKEVDSSWEQTKDMSTSSGEVGNSNHKKDNMGKDREKDKKYRNEKELSREGMNIDFEKDDLKENEQKGLNHKNESGPMSSGLSEKIYIGKRESY